MRTGSTDTLQTMYIFCSSDATMIPDVDHHLFLGFWLQHHNYSTASMDGVTSYFYLSFASEAFILDFSWTFSRVNASVREHALRHQHTRQTHRPRGLCFATFSLPANLHFSGIRDWECAMSFRNASLMALVRRFRFLLAFVRLEICPFCSTILASRK